jgi:stress-induced morphogen
MEARKESHLRIVTTMMAMASERIHTMLEQAFPGSDVTVTDRTGTGDHFHVSVVSGSFDGLPLVDQHRLVNRALEAPLADGTIHELRITTRGRA